MTGVQTCALPISTAVSATPSIGTGSWWFRSGSSGRSPRASERPRGCSAPPVSSVTRTPTAPSGPTQTSTSSTMWTVPLYDFLRYMEIEIDKDMAAALYTGLVTDSGNFIYENVTSDTLRKAANLVDFGADRRYIYRMLYQMNKLEALLLQNEILSNTKLYYNNKLAISYVNYKLFEKYNCKKEDLEGLVNIYRDLECVEVSIFLVEEKFEEIKASMRSKEYVDLSVIGKALGGGGHRRSEERRVGKECRSRWSPYH